MNKERILEHYLECALWTDEEELEESGCGDINIYNLDSASLEKAKLDIDRFLFFAGDAVNGIEEKQLGHDMWLSRNGHGAGFFDRGYEQEIQDRLEEAAKKLGSSNIYCGDDGKIYFDYN